MGRIRAIRDGQEIIVSGEMTLEPLGFIVFDHLPFRYGDGTSVEPDMQESILIDLQHEFARKERVLSIKSQQWKPGARLAWPPTPQGD